MELAGSKGAATAARMAESDSEPRMLAVSGSVSREAIEGRTPVVSRSDNLSLAGRTLEASWGV